jgi:hypothetical protein
MLWVVGCLVLGLVLLASAGLKLAGGARARAALATYGIKDERAARGAWGALIAVEAALGVAVALGSDVAAYAAAGLLAAFAAAQAVLLVSGRGGAPCGCLGARGKVGRVSVARAGLLAAALATLPLLPHGAPSTDEWLAIGLAAALLGLLTLAVVVLALAREVGELRLSLNPPGALEIAHEGPEVGARTALAERFGADLAPGRLGVAVFTSEGCRMCQALAQHVYAVCW